jgi:hypothetical protein
MTHMAEDTRKNAAAVGMRQVQAVGSFPGAPWAPLEREALLLAQMGVQRV